MFVLGPAPVGVARSFAPGAPGALLRDRQRRAHGDQAGQAAPVVHPGHAGQPRVHDRPHARDGEAGLGDRGGQHDPASRPRPQGGVLLPGGQPAVQRQHVHVGLVLQQPCGPRDLGGTGQEREHIAGLLAQGGAHRACHRRLGRLLPFGRDVRGSHGMGMAVHAHHRCRVLVGEQVGQPIAGHGRGGGQHPQVGPQAIARVEQQRQQQVRVQVPLVALVQDDGVHAGQVGIGLEPTYQQSGGHHLDQGAVRRLPLAPHGVADPLAHPLTDQLGHAAGGGPAREPAGFGHHHAQPPRRQCQRHEGGLPGARRRHEHAGSAAVQRVAYRAQIRPDRQVGKFGQEQRHTRDGIAAAGAAACPPSPGGAAPSRRQPGPAAGRCHGRRRSETLGIWRRNAMLSGAHWNPAVRSR